MGSLVLRMRVCPVLMVEMLSVPKNIKLLAVPLFELYDNTASLQDRTVRTGVLTRALAVQYGCGGFIG